MFNLVVLPSLPRRRLLAGGAAAGVAAPVLSAAAAPTTPAAPDARVFAHGVASGDPAPTSVVLWTRVTPTRASTPGSGQGPRVVVAWEVATDRAFRRVVGRGRFETGPARDHTVKLTAGGLRPATTYHYRFRLGDAVSRVGRTRTAPATDARPGRLRLGFVSCANVQRGFFSAYRHLAARDDVDVVVHLGDYLYESYREDDVREHVPPREILDLTDYRQRHAQYKADADLQALHAAHPMVTVWDDHETANDAWRDGAGAHDPASEGAWRTRRARAHRAYDEWMPARLEGTVRLGDGDRLFRTVRFGRLADLHLLDLRSYRDEQVGMEDAEAVADPARTITGRQQLDWLKASLADSRAQWQLVGNPVMIAPLSLGGLPDDVAASLASLFGATPATAAGGVPLNTDAWDGYTDDRRELFAHITELGLRDVLFLTGDIHTGLAADLPLDKTTYPASGTAGVELVCTSVTSDNFKDETMTPPGTTSEAIALALASNNPHFTYANLDDHGYCVLDLTPQRARCEWWVIASREDPHAGERRDTVRTVVAGTGRLNRIPQPG